MKKVVLVGLILMAIILKCLSTRVIISKLEEQNNHAAQEELILDEE